jgi:hypothetical protein
MVLSSIGTLPNQDLALSRASDSASIPQDTRISARRNERSQCVPTAVQVRFHGDPFTGMREIHVNDGDFPSFEQMLAGGPAAAFPKEIWQRKCYPASSPFATKTSRVGSAYLIARWMP